jgi:hypothetical protein
VRETRYNYICGFAASSPTDLLIKNNSSEKVKIDLLVKESTLKRFASIELDPHEEKQICIENEDEITDGLYFDFNGEQTMVKLKSQQSQTFFIKERVLYYQ